MTRTMPMPRVIRIPATCAAGTDVHSGCEMLPRGRARASPGPLSRVAPKYPPWAAQVQRRYPQSRAGAPNQTSRPAPLPVEGTGYCGRRGLYQWGTRRMSVVLPVVTSGAVPSQSSFYFPRPSCLWLLPVWSTILTVPCLALFHVL